MRLVPNSEGLREFNSCHDPKDGRFCQTEGPADVGGSGGVPTSGKTTMARLRDAHDLSHLYSLDSGTEMGSIWSHTGDVLDQWPEQRPKNLDAISRRWGRDLDHLLDVTLALHDIGKGEAVEAYGYRKGVEVAAAHTVPVLQRVLRAEGFHPDDIALATELVNHDLLGMTQRGWEEGRTAAGELRRKAAKVGMPIEDFATLQMAYYLADASAYPYIRTNYMERRKGRWQFKNDALKDIYALGSKLRESNDCHHPRGSSKGGQFCSKDERGTYAGFDHEAGYQWHETGPVRDWAKTVPYTDAVAISNYAGFGSTEINSVRRGQFPTKHIDRKLTDEELGFVGGNYHTPLADRLRAGEQIQRGDETWMLNFSMGGFIARRTVVDEERVAKAQQQADTIDAHIARRGYVLPETTEVKRGVYLPDVTPEMLQQMVGSSYTEKGFTSTMTSPERLSGYTAWGKFESLHRRFGDIKSHEDENGVAMRISITLPKGTKVTSVEAVRRTDWEVPYNEEALARGDYQRDWDRATQRPDLRDRSEAEVLLGSGARFKITKVQRGEDWVSSDGTLKPVPIWDVHMVYLGGGSSDPGKRRRAR